MAPPKAFANYPTPVEGPKAKFESYAEQNPELRGIPLYIGANVIASVNLIQKYLWKNAGFGQLKDMPELDDPTVVPLGENGPGMLPWEPELQATHNGGTSDKPRYYTAADYHEMYKAGKVTPLQVAETLLALTGEGQKQASIYADAWAESHGKDFLALEAAKASTERYAAGKPLGILDGVPVGIKDDIDVKGYVSHYGMKYRPDIDFFKEQAESVWPVKKLQEAGAVVIGKNRMHECGCEPSGANVAQGTPTNHFNSSYYPGGSTSGGCSALGAGVVPIVLGTDAGGSVRVPASFNGVFGLKPTHHRTMEIKMSTCVLGPIAATAADLAIAYRHIAQPDPDSPAGRLFAASQPPPPGAKKFMGVWRDWWAVADPRVQDVCNKALNYFAAKHGYEIVDISIPWLAESRVAHSLICVTEMTEKARRRTPNPADWLSLVSSPTKLLMSVSSNTPAADYLKANGLRELMMQHMAFLFQKYPGLLIMTPTTPLVGWARSPGDDSYGFSDTNTTIKSMMYIYLSNLVGTPSLSAPVGYVDPDQGKGKLPIGILAMGEWGAEEQLLVFAREAEEYLHEAYEGGRKRPDTWLDVLGEASKEATA
ncbi:unnamed protein product [Clonostachys rhizophaga]|uniref:Amidase domain-containing protein n=1 Tax=Clonostachys rhizophaga TaxID=160324 RepID=A0A9N9YM50_9HYPO|nr:unnamed protein product [Clonostachys rhizophaga]